MGACSFSLNIDAKNDKQFAKAFHAAAEEDRYENGNDAYRGTIGQKNSWVMVQSTPVDPSELSELQEKYDSGKWDPPHAVPVAERKLVGKAKTKTIKVEASDKWEAYRKVREMFPGQKVEIGDTSLLREARYALKKIEIGKGWRIRFNAYNEEIFGTKGECTKRYKELILAGKSCTMMYMDSSYERVKTKESQYSVTVTHQKWKVGNKISHYFVWGWAAE